MKELAQLLAESFFSNTYFLNVICSQTDHKGNKVFTVSVQFNLTKFKCRARANVACVGDQVRCPTAAYAFVNLSTTRCCKDRNTMMVTQVQCRYKMIRKHHVEAGQKIIFNCKSNVTFINAGQFF